MSPTAGSCRARRSVIPAFAGLRSSCMATKPHPSPVGNFWPSARWTSNVLWVFLPATTPTAMSSHQSTAGPFAVAHPPLRLQRKGHPATCPTELSPGVTIKGILPGVGHSMTLSRRSRSLKFVVKGLHPRPSAQSVRMNFKKPLKRCNENPTLTASASIPWSAFDSVL